MHVSTIRRYDCSNRPAGRHQARGGATRWHGELRMTRRPELCRPHWRWHGHTTRQWWHWLANHFLPYATSHERRLDHKPCMPRFNTGHRHKPRESNHASALAYQYRMPSTVALYTQSNVLHPLHSGQELSPSAVFSSIMLFSVG